MSTSLRSEISSVRQEFKSLIEPLQCMVEAHEVAVNELERAATDHSAKISDLEAAVGTLTLKVKRLEEKHEDLEGRSRRNNIASLVGLKEWKDPMPPTLSPSSSKTRLNWWRRPCLTAHTDRDERSQTKRNHVSHYC